MGFRLVPELVTLNYLDWRNGCSLHYTTEFSSFGANYVKVVEDWHIVCDRNVAQKFSF